MSNLVVYSTLIIVIVILSIYYNELNKKKIILQEFFTNNSVNQIVDDRINSVFSSLNALSKDYKNLQQKNQLLNNSLQEDHYNKYSNDLTNRYTQLSKDSKELGEEIRRKQKELKDKAQEIKNQHSPDYVNNRKNTIINQNIRSINEQLNLDGVNASRVLEIVQNIIDEKTPDKIANFRKNIQNNREVIKNIDDVYDKAKQNLSNNMGSIKDSIKNNIDKYVKESLEKKKLSLPFEDLSKYQGVLVRTYNSQSIGDYGSLLNEIVVPSINYYMSNVTDGFFNSSPKGSNSRYAEFLGFIQFPKDVNTLQFYISTGSSFRFYFGGSLIGDASNANTSNELTTRLVYGEPNSKVPFKIQVNEGTNTINSFVILKWRKNNSGIYDVVPSGNFFLPNLKSY